MAGELGGVPPLTYQRHVWPRSAQDAMQIVAVWSSSTVAGNAQDCRADKVAGRRVYGCKQLASAVLIFVLSSCAYLPVVDGAEYIEDFTLCRARQSPDVYGNVTSLSPTTFVNCLSLPTADLLGSNIEVTYIAHKTLREAEPGRPPVEIVLVGERRRSIQYLGVIVEGDFAQWDLDRTPKRAFRGHSCLDREQFCSIQSVMITHEGFWAVDRHRVQRFSFTWIPRADEDERTLSENVMASYGNFNIKPLEGTHKASLQFPYELAEYKPYNSSWITPDTEIDPSFPFTYDLSVKRVKPHYVFVTDTGNHRLVMLNATEETRLEYITQFGATGVPKDGTHGFNWPVGVAVRIPGTPVSAQPPWNKGCLANVLVTDQMNDRLVKLDLMDTVQGLRLQFGGDYGSSKEVRGTYRGLSQPAGVGLFRHYILVCERLGNAITLLMIDYRDPRKINFVTQLKPQPGILFLGSFAVTSAGYLWYIYVKDSAVYSIGTMHLQEALRESVAPSLLGDLRVGCVNKSWINTEVITNTTYFRSYLYSQLATAGVNYKFSWWKSVSVDKPFVAIKSFNTSNGFDFDLFNSTVYGGMMKYCEAPARPTSPPMNSGNEEGWQMDGVQALPTAAAGRRCRNMQMLIALGATALSWIGSGASSTFAVPGAVFL